ncbi:MAG: 3'-5' exonuclease [Porphyromonas sp.]|nr:3'-5' exonuclease [Porphyromonas sp.]
MKKDWMIKESELDDDQLHVLMETLDKSCVVSGCAGSGKSVLALIKAQRVQKERGDDYKVIVFTKALCRYMNSGRRELGLKNEFYYHWDWVNRKGCPSAEYIIVDEIQDFSEVEIDQFIQATGKNFFFFGDTAQSIYEGLKTTVAVDEIRDIVPIGTKVKNWELYRNYRLPLPVARVVQAVGIDLPPFIESVYKSRETAMPVFLKCPTLGEQIATIHRIISQRGLTDVAILLPTNKDVLRIYQNLEELGGNYELKCNAQDDLNFTSSNPKIMTYHSAKGLQFEAVFLPCIENFSGEEKDRKALYVAMTRTYRNLYVLYTGRLPAPLSSINSSLYNTTEIEDIDDI